MKTKRERNKQLKFLQAYTNPTNRYVFFSGGRHYGRTFFNRRIRNAENYLIQEQNAHKQLNLMLQANYAELEIRAITLAIKNGTYPEMDITSESPTARISTVKITKTTGGGSSYSVDCPKCGKTKILSSELNTMTPVCNKCHTSFKLAK